MTASTAVDTIDSGTITAYWLDNISICGWVTILVSSITYYTCTLTII